MITGKIIILVAGLAALLLAGPAWGQAYEWVADFTDWSGQDGTAVSQFPCPENPETPREFTVVISAAGSNWLMQGSRGGVPRTAKFENVEGLYTRCRFSTVLPASMDIDNGASFAWTARYGSDYNMGTRAPVQLQVRNSAGVVERPYLAIVAGGTQLAIRGNVGGDDWDIPPADLPYNVQNPSLYHHWSVSVLEDASDSNVFHWKAWLNGEQIMFTGDNGQHDYLGQWWSFKTTTTVGGSGEFRLGDLAHKSNWNFEFDCVSFRNDLNDGEPLYCTDAEYCGIAVSPVGVQEIFAYWGETADPESVTYQVGNFEDEATEFKVEVSYDPGNPGGSTGWLGLSVDEGGWYPLSVGASAPVVATITNTELQAGIHTAYLTFTDDCEDPANPPIVRQIDLEIVGCLGRVTPTSAIYRTVDAATGIVDHVVFTFTNLVGTDTYTVAKVGTCDWLTLIKGGAEPLDPGESDTITGEIDPDGLAPGVYTCEIKFTDDCNPAGEEIRTVHISVRDETYDAQWYAAEFENWDGQDRDAVTPLVSFPNDVLVRNFTVLGHPDPQDRGAPPWLTQGLIGMYPTTAKFYYNWFTWARAVLQASNIPLRQAAYDPELGLAWVWRQKLGDYIAWGTDPRRGPIQLILPTQPGQETDGSYSADVPCYSAYINILSDTLTGSGDPIREIRILNNDGNRYGGIAAYVLPESLVDEYHLWSASGLYDASFDAGNAYWNLYIGGRQIMFGGADGSVEGPGGKVYSFRTGQQILRIPYLRYGEMGRTGTEWFWDMECDYIRMTTLDVAGGPYWDGQGWSPASPLLCPRVWADANRDGVIDQEDFAWFQACYTGTGDPSQVFDDTSICACFDRDGYGDVDGYDLAMFELCATGPDVPYDEQTMPEECLTDGATGFMSGGFADSTTMTREGGSTVTYTLGLGGDNQADLYNPEPPVPNYPQFDTSGATDYTESDGQTFTVTAEDRDVTWSVKVGLSGVHQGGRSNGFVPSGLANFVFNLELRNEANQLVGDVIYHSTINDGAYPDPLHWAAFTFIYDIDGRGVPAAPGRVIDTLYDPPLGGPGLTRHQYPSKTGAVDSLDEPLAVATPPGTLRGMGAGYPEYIPAELIDWGWPWSDYFFGVGMDTLTEWGYAGLGVVPLAEGQMDLCWLPTGTYTLRVTSKAQSNNILEGDFDPDIDYVGRFADQANSVVGDQITFLLVNDCGIECFEDEDCPEGVCVGFVCVDCRVDADCDDGDLCTTYECQDNACVLVDEVECPEGEICNPATGECVECLEDTDCPEGEFCVGNVCVPPPVIDEAWSAADHGAVGAFYIDIDVPHPYAIELRRGADQWLEFVFDQEIDIAAADVDVSSGAVSPSLASKYVANDTLVATLATLPDNNACLTITVSGVTDVTGLCVMDPATFHLRMVQGEVNESPPVNLTDMSIVRADLYQPVTVDNFMCDVNADGVINLTDMSLVRSNLYQQAVCPMPPLGACCFADGHCEQLTETDCPSAAGTEWTAGLSCDPNPCAQPGACCEADGGCYMSTVVEPGDCGAGDTYFGDDTVCDPNPCEQPEPTGACCAIDESCTVTTEDDCMSADGFWLGEGSGCDPNPCVAPSGMVLIPAGEFMMGDTFNEGESAEQPVHAVYVDAFYIDKYEVTNQQYAEALNWAWSQGGHITVTSGVVYQYGSGTYFPYCDTTTISSSSRITWNGTTFGVVSGYGNHAMARVSWYGAVAFCNWRSAMQGRTPCYNLSTWVCNFNANGYRLPTEAEWEKAARGSVSGRRFPWSDQDTIQHARANYYSYWSGGAPYYPYDTSPTEGFHPTFNTGNMPYTSPVGYFAPNGYGLYDMAGNVWEWCNDWYSSTYYSSSPYNNPRGPTSGTGRVLRGGGWGNDAVRCRVAYRYGAGPDHRNTDGGFRMALGSP